MAGRIGSNVIMELPIYTILLYQIYSLYLHVKEDNYVLVSKTTLLLISLNYQI